MARIRILLVAVLALTAGGGLALATYNFTQKPGRTVTIPTRPVIVAATDLDIGAELRPEDLRVVEWPANGVPKDAFADTAEVIGRGIIYPVIENEPILPNKLASKEAGAGLPPAIPPGLRAVSVRVNEVIGVAGYVLPGTRVDVVATVSPTDQKADMTSKVILTNVQVLAAGTKIERDDRQEQADAGVGRHAARQPGRSRAADAGQQRRQDSARAQKSARYGHHFDNRRAAVGAARPGARRAAGRAGPPARIRSARDHGGAGAGARPRARCTHCRNHPRR